MNDAQRLASLVIEYLSSGRLRPTTPPQVVSEMLQLARKITGEPAAVDTSDEFLVTLDKSTVRFYLYHEQILHPEANLSDAICAYWRRWADAPEVTAALSAPPAIFSDSNPHDPAAYQAGMYSGEQDANGHIHFVKDGA